MKIHFHGRDVEAVVDIQPGTTVRAALSEAGILPSMVIVSHNGTVLPHATSLNNEVELLVTTISSGG